MKALKVGGTKISLRKYPGGYMRLEVSDQLSTVTLPDNRSLQLHHLQKLSAWIRQAEQELEGKG